ncbi:MAG TPA: 50S ribosomal protein L23 [Candidatus Nanoarchaeia archaeon]|nr:50S ribosomal protein L23 [Candidatus Nanoarchaeia archaeon]
MSIIKHPFVTEKATYVIEENNTLQFIVDINATKTQIKREIEKLYGIPIFSVNTMITMKGKKKAIVTFEGDNTASELASKLGIF